MKVLFEGQKYKVMELKKYFGDKFYHQNDNLFGTINVVGYYHSNMYGLFYFIPKVFIDDGNKFLGKIHYSDLFEEDVEHIINDINLLNWLRRFLILFYKSLIEYKSRVNSDIIDKENTFQLSTSLGDKEYTFLDLTLSIVNYYKKNRNLIIFQHKKIFSAKHRKPSWNKTIQKSIPYYIDNDTQIYDVALNRIKTINSDETLLVYFYSVLVHLKEEYKLDLSIDCPYTIIRGKQFDKLLENGIYKLKKIKHKYFSDTLKKVYNLLELFFYKTYKGSVSNEKKEFIIVRSYHAVFEDMIDKLITDDISDTKTSDRISLKDLKNNKDGKILDHIFPYEGLIDKDEKVFYIGDSKYYKYNSQLSEVSIYKQFTYSKNVIQFNIDLLNEGKTIKFKDGSEVRYRDQITEGYNITPNFFIEGKVYELFDFNNSRLELNKERGIEMSAHFKDRLFDRDTLYINYYEINFLYVLYSYVNFSKTKLIIERNKIHRSFKVNFTNFFNNKDHFQIYKYDFANREELVSFVENEFRKIIGKVYKPRSEKENTIILAVSKKDEILSKSFKIINCPTSKKTEYIYNCKNGIKLYFEKYKLE